MDMALGVNATEINYSPWYKNFPLFYLSPFSTGIFTTASHYEVLHLPNLLKFLQMLYNLIRSTK